MAKVGLVLSGGMVKGAYQIGVLKSLRKYINADSIECISTASIGTLAGYAYLSDKLDIYEKLWLENESFNMRTFLRSTIKRSVILDKVSLLVDNNATISKDFFTALINMNKMSLDYTNLKSVDKNLLNSYFKASISFVPVFKTIEINKINYLDGALVDNIPVIPISKYDLDYIIIVHFDKNKYVYSDLKNKNVIEINFNTKTSISKSLSFDSESSQDMIQRGYAKAEEIFSDVFKKGTDNLKYIEERIENLNKNKIKEKYNMSGDIIVDRINKVAKKLVKHNMKE